MSEDASRATVAGERGLQSRRALIEVALGRREADLYIRNGTLVNVYSGEMLEEQDNS